MTRPDEFDLGPSPVAPKPKRRAIPSPTRLGDCLQGDFVELVGIGRRALVSFHTRTQTFVRPEEAPSSLIGLPGDAPCRLLYDSYTIRAANGNRVKVGGTL